MTTQTETRAAPGSVRELLTVALPLVFSSASVTVMFVIDRMFLTWYSKDALAASMPAGMLHWLVLSAAFGTATYVNSFVAQYEGVQRRDRVAAALWQGLYFAVAAGVPITLCTFLATPIFEWIGHAPEVRRLEADFFGTLCFGSIPMLAAAVLSSFYSGRGRTLTVMWVNFFGSCTNIVLDRLLIFGWGPIPEYGIKGAAVATVIAEFAMAAIYLLLILRGSEGKTYRVWATCGYDRDLFRRLLRYGFPNGFHMFADVFCFEVFILLIGLLGTDTQAATNLAFNLNTLAFLPMLGFGTAIMSLVGKRIGEGRPDLATRTTWIAFRLAAAYMLVFGAIYVLLPDVILAPYARHSRPEEFAQIQPLVTLLLRFIAVYSLFDAMAIVFGSAIRGAGDTLFPLLFSLLSGWFLMVVPTYLGHRYGGGLMVAWSACTGYVMAIGLAFFLRFRQGAWKSMRIIEESAPADCVPNGEADCEPELSDCGPAPLP
jgi:MATE family multidrug resistance protein